ncbi:hypothetical protein [Streptomyces sp. NPDC048349]|uniref:hypothetical protein n=1 Tax=Streptomyces sp. NPDC048349 TaxID=3155486 RepID=UPI003433634C
MDTNEVLLDPGSAPAAVASWAPMPIASRLAEAARRVEVLRPFDGQRAAGIRKQISTLQALVGRGECEQRQRAAWRTLKAEIATFQDLHCAGAASPG